MKWRNGTFRMRTTKGWEKRMGIVSFSGRWGIDQRIEGFALTHTPTGRQVAAALHDNFFRTEQKAKDFCEGLADLGVDYKGLTRRTVKKLCADEKWKAGLKELRTRLKLI